MGWVANARKNLPDETKVKLSTLGGVVDAHAYFCPIDNIAVLFDGTDYITYVYWAALEVFETDPPKVECDATDYYQETSTGALYKRQPAVSSYDDHFICIGSVKPSKTVLKGDIPVGFKRLYKEA